MIDDSGIADADWIGHDDGPDEPEFASNCCPNCGHVLRSPKGKPNQTVVDALLQYPEIPRRAMICNKHGLWFDRLDDLWPVYWQNNKCKECK